jgi:prolipoprotein diacylglyceryltransferase
VWSLLGALLIIYLDKRLDLRGGRVFWLYVMVYTSGRLWIEMVRIDDAHHFFGVRVNVFVAAAALVGSSILFFWLGARQRRLATHVPRNQLAATAPAGGDPSADSDGGEPPGTRDDAADTGRVEA